MKKIILEEFCKNVKFMILKMVYTQKLNFLKNGTCKILKSFEIQMDYLKKKKKKTYLGMPKD